ATNEGGPAGPPWSLRRRLLALVVERSGQAVLVVGGAVAVDHALAGGLVVGAGGMAVGGLGGLAVAGVQGLAHPAGVGLQRGSYRLVPHAAFFVLSVPLDLGLDVRQENLSVGQGRVAWPARSLPGENGNPLTGAGNRRAGGQRHRAAQRGDRSSLGRWYARPPDPTPPPRWISRACATSASSPTSTTATPPQPTGCST